MEGGDGLYCITSAESGFMRIWDDDMADVMSCITGYTLVGRGLTYDEALCLVKINNAGKDIFHGFGYNN